jgi:hypothetical protein
MEIIDPAGDSGTQHLPFDMAEYNQYAIPGFNSRVTISSSAVIVSQVCDLGQLRVHYFSVVAPASKIVRLQLSGRVFILNFVLASDLVLGCESLEPLPLLAGQLQLLDIPIGNYDLLIPPGNSRILGIELSPEYLQQFLRDEFFITVQAPVSPKVYRNAAASLSVQMMHMVGRILSNKHKGIVGYTHIELAAKELVLEGMHLLHGGAGEINGASGRTAERMEAVKGYTISREDAASLQAIKGIGGKTAQRVIIELKDKLKKETWDETQPAISPGVHNTIRNEALSALLTLGLPKAAAEKSIDTVLKKSGNPITLEDLVKQALKNA